MVNVQQLALLALLCTVAVVLYVVPLLVNQAYWSLVALLPLLFLPVPWFFVPPKDSFGSVGGGDSDAVRHWAEFLTSFGAVGVLGIPVVLWHVTMIEWIDVVLSCCASIVLATGFALFVYWQIKQHSEEHGFNFI